MEQEKLNKILDENFTCTCDKIYTSRKMVDPDCFRHDKDYALEMMYELGFNTGRDKALDWAADHWCDIQEYQGEIKSILSGKTHKDLQP